MTVQLDYVSAQVVKAGAPHLNLVSTFLLAAILTTIVAIVSHSSKAPDSVPRPVNAIISRHFVPIAITVQLSSVFAKRDIAGALNQQVVFRFLCVVKQATIVENVSLLRMELLFVVKTANATTFPQTVRTLRATTVSLVNALVPTVKVGAHNAKRVSPFLTVATHMITAAIASISRSALASATSLMLATTFPLIVRTRPITIVKLVNAYVKKVILGAQLERSVFKFRCAA